MGSIHQRRMDAESEANKEISSKHYQHTAAYSLLAGEDSEAIRASAMSGKEINTRLTERAKTYVRNQAAINNYHESHLGTRNFRSDALLAADEELIKKRHEQWGNDRKEKTRDYVEELRVRSTNSSVINHEDNKNKNQTRRDKLDNIDNKPKKGLYNIRGVQRESTQPRKHHFQDRSYRHYDPYQ